ncbi:MAG: hypothetical protein EB124_04545 [Betaproteobacteria bacterium]|nr:hypothetical protein [Betaproteobacteria bacterium]
MFNQSDEDVLVERCESSQEVFRGHFFAVSRDRVRQSDGSIHTREFIRHPGAADVKTQIACLWLCRMHEGLLAWPRFHPASYWKANPPI